MIGSGKHSIEYRKKNSALKVLKNYFKTSICGASKTENRLKI